MAERTKLERSLDDANAEVNRLLATLPTFPTRAQRHELNHWRRRAEGARQALRQHREKMEARGS